MAGQSGAGRVGTALAAVLTAASVLAVVSCSTASAPSRAPALTDQGAPAFEGRPGSSEVVLQAMTRSRPVRLQIADIKVDTALIDLGLQRDGRLQVPPDGTRAGWFTGAPTPGERGPAVITAHVDWGGSKGVFYDLRRLRVGAGITVLRQDGSAAVFVISAVQQVPKGTFPTQQVYGDVDHPALRLVTCGGSFDHAAHSYRDNIVVFADLLAARTS